MLGNCLFGVVKSTKNADLDKYEYSGYDIGFDTRSQSSLADGSWIKIALILGADTSSSLHNKQRYLSYLRRSNTRMLPL